MKKEVKRTLGFQLGNIPKIVTKPLKQHFHLENNFKICISGAAGGNITEEAMRGAYEIGRQIGLRGAILVTGATTGIPYVAARGNYDVGGLAIGFSPASSALEHVKAYKLPTDYHDVIVYTGFNYAGRNLLLTRSCDAVITIGGRIGTLNEFTIAFEDRKICGVLEGTGGMADHVRKLLEVGQRTEKNVIFSKDPGELVHLVIERLKAGYAAEGGVSGKRRAY